MTINTIMLRTVVLLAALLAAAPALGGQAADGGAVAGPVAARNSVVVSGDVIRLGDLFTNAGEHADASVAYAPDPGKRAVFDISWLYRVARAYKLDWRPAHKRVRVIVERDAQVISRDEIADHILAALVERGADPGLRVDISNRSLRLFVPTESASMVAVEDVSYDRRAQRFAAIVAAPADDPAAQRVRVTGRLHKMVDVPVLARRIVKGEVIKRDDIEWVAMRADRVQHNAVLDAENLIGKTARRSVLRAGQPVMARNVRRPLLVDKGAMVTMVMRIPNMMLTAKGRALEGGSDGDVIRVVNSQSNTVVETVVIGGNRVAVAPLADQIAMAQ